MSSEPTAKSCAICGADVATVPHHQNRAGQYVCEACSSQSARHDGLRTCIFCGTQVPRRKCHKNRYGEYVCRACRKAGHRWSRRRVLVHSLWRMRRGVVYAGVAAAGAWVFWKLLAKLVRNGEDAQE